MSETFDPYRVWLGVPPESRPPTHYELLGISPNETEAAVINAAVVRQSAYVRNFQIGKYAQEATHILIEIAAAKACLLDPAKRAKYDAEVKARQRAAPTTASPVAPFIDLDQLAAPPSNSPSVPAAGSRQRSSGRLPTFSGRRKSISFPWQIAAVVTVAIIVVGTVFVAVRPRGDEPLQGQLTAAEDGHPSAAVEAKDLATPAPTPGSSEPVSLDGSFVPDEMKAPDALDNASVPSSSAVASPELPTGVDLLKLIDLERDRISGDWRMENGKLRVVNGDGATIKIPYRPDGEYTLRLKVRRSDFGGPGDYGGIVLPIVYAGKRLDMYLSGGWKGSRIIETESVGDAVDFVPSDKPIAITCAVRSDGFVVTNDAGAKIERKGVFEKHSPSPDNVPAGWLFLAAYSNYEFSELSVSPAALVGNPPDLRATVVAPTAVAEGSQLLSHAVAWYRAEGNADDSVGMSRGTVNGDVGFAERVAGKAFKFDGGSGSVLFNGPFIFNRPGDASLTFCLCSMSAASQGQSALVWGRGDGDDVNRFHIYLDAGGLLGMDYLSPSGALHPLFSQVPVGARKFTDITIVRANMVYSLYVNGKKLVTATDTAPDLPTSHGWQLSGRPGYWFVGEVDELATFDRALTETEIKTIYLGTREVR